MKTRLFEFVAAHGHNLDAIEADADGPGLPYAPDDGYPDDDPDWYTDMYESEQALRDAESGAAYERQCDAWSARERDGMDLETQRLAGYR